MLKNKVVVEIISEKKKYNLRKKPKQQITFRLEEGTIKKLKTIEKYHSKIDRIINLGMVFLIYDDATIDDFKNAKVINNDELKRINEMVELKSKLDLELKESMFKFKMRYILAEDENAMEVLDKIRKDD